MHQSTLICENTCYIYMCVFIYVYIYTYIGFPDSSVGKESACIARDPDLIPGSGGPPGEG